MEADRHVILHQHDPVKDAAADIARALEREDALAHDHQGLIAGLQPCGQVRLILRAEKRLTDGGH